MGKGYYVSYFTKQGNIEFTGLFRQINNARNDVVENLKNHFGIEIHDYDDYDDTIKESLAVQSEECDFVWMEVDD